LDCVAGDREALNTRRDGWGPKTKCRWRVGGILGGRSAKTTKLTCAGPSLTGLLGHPAVPAVLTHDLIPGVCVASCRRDD
jgi:hypothetical protein